MYHKYKERRDEPKTKLQSTSQVTRSPLHQDSDNNDYYSNDNEDDGAPCW